MAETCAFFYGTLMHPKILKRVIKNDGSHLQICPAVLMEYTRHKVKWAEYPGIVPYAQSRILCNRELGPEEKSVRGVLVKGLTHTDMIVLDLFEGPEYVRKCVSAHQLGALVKLSEHPSDEESLITTKLPPLPSLVDLAPALDAETYVYKNFENLDAELWSFEDFVKNNARKWYGERHENRNQDDSEVEKRRRAGRGGAAALARYMAAQRSIDDVLAYSVVTFFVLFFFSDGLSSRVNSLYLLTKNHPPEFSRYREMRTLPPDQFPLDDPHRRVIIVGDVHGMHKQLSALLHGLSFEQPSDVFIHVGDIISKGSHDGSMAILSYMTSNNITGVRGNHDQKVIEWRGWINWIRSLPEGKEWFEKLDTRWVEAEADGASPDLWVEKEKKKNKSKWWKTIPKDWILFGDHYKVARGMSKAQYDYLLSLPLRLYIPSAHTFIVHGGLLPSNPLYPPGHSRQPLAHVPNLPLAITKGKSLLKNDTIAVMRGLQELSLLEDVPQNKVPWTVLNLRSILSGMVSNRKDGKAWPKIWKHDMSRCEGFDHDVPTKPKDDLLPCYPFSIIYGHTASRGLDVHRWSFGLDTGCVYKRRLTALVLGPQNLRSVSFKRQEQGDKNEEDSEYDIDTVKSVPFGDNGQASVVSISCS